MDPNAALAEIREIVKNTHDARYVTFEKIEHELERLVDLIDGLDNWLSKGGFKPRDWL